MNKWMHNRLKKTQTVIGLGVLTALTGIPLSAMAGGFQLYEENVTNLGNAFAGTGAEADDASTEFYNPAGMTRLLNPQLLIAGTLIGLDVNANVTSATSTRDLQIDHADFGFLNVHSFTVDPVTGASNLKPGATVPVPAFHFVYPLNNWAFGFGATVPFGLMTTYPNTAITRYLATESSVETVNIGPDIAYQFNPHFSAGFGIDEQYMSATFNQMLPSMDFARIFGTVQGGMTDAAFTNEGDSWATGWHAGVLYQFTPETRVGLDYHSEVKHQIKGPASADIDAHLSVPGLPTVPFVAQFTGNFVSNVTLPDYADLSFYHDINCQWAVLASLDYTHWSTIQDIEANYSGTIGDAVHSASIPLLFRDTYRVSAGVNYKPTDKLILRGGTAFDESPVPNAEARTFRLPDSNRFWLAAGAGYIINKSFTVDVGYSHLFTQRSTINNTQTLGGNFSFPLFNQIAFSQAETGVGSFDSSVNEVGAQLIWNIV